jgi:two-component system OmpR family sensor kinase
VASAIDSTSKPWSLQRRLRNNLWVAIAALWLVGSGLALFVQWRETNELLDSSQAEIARLALNLPTGQLDPTERLSKADDNNVFIQVFDPKGELIWRSAMAPTTPMAILSVDAVTIEHGRRVLVHQDPVNHRTAIVSASLYDREEALSGATEAFLMPLLVLLPLTALTLTWLLRKAFSPIDAMRRALEERKSTELTVLPSTGLSVEFKPLVEGLNRLFERLSKARKAEIAFAANSAHELRTPIAAAQAQLQRLSHELRQGAPVEAMTQRIDTVGRQLDRLQHLCVKLMQLSRAESGVATKVAPIDLLTVTRLVLDEFDKPEQARRITLSVEDRAEQIMAMGDIDALAIALRNLIENALLHGGPDTNVQVHVSLAPAIDVIDSGPGIPADRLDTVRQPFERGESASPGHGLGMSIVNHIAQQMGGQLLLESPHAQGQGLHARIALNPPVPAAMDALAARID